MKKFTIILATAVLLLGCASRDGFNSAQVQRYNAFHPAKVWLDNNGRHINAHGAGFIFDGGKYYMFGEHKLGGVLGNRSVVGVHCYASSDLYNWEDLGIVLKMSDNPDSKIFIGTVVERPKVLFNKRTGKYVMFFHIESRRGKTARNPNLDVIEKERPNYSTAMIGFAVADKISGPYEFVKAQRLHAGILPQNASKELVDLVKSGKGKEHPSFGGVSKKGKTPNDTFAKYFSGCQEKIKIVLTNGAF